MLCIENHFTNTAWYKIFGKEFYQSFFYATQKDLHVDERPNYTEKATFFAQKTPTQPVNKAKYSQKKGITLILFYYINYSIFSFQHVNTNHFNTCQNAGLPTLWIKWHQPVSRKPYVANLYRLVCWHVTQCQARIGMQAHTIFFFFQGAVVSAQARQFDVRSSTSIEWLTLPLTLSQGCSSVLLGIKKKEGKNIHLLLGFFCATQPGENDTTGTIRAGISLIFSIRNDTSNLGVLVRGPEKGWLPLSRREGTPSGGKSKVVSICYKDPSLETPTG